MRHKLFINPTSIEAARGLYINTGCCPKVLEMVDMTLGDQVKVISDSSSSPLDFVNPGILQDVSAGTVSKLSLGVTAHEGHNDDDAFVPSGFESVDGLKVYTDKTGREILGVFFNALTVAGKLFTFDIDGVTKTYTEGAGGDFLQGASAAASCTNAAAAIVAGETDVTAIADGDALYLIKAEGIVVDNVTSNDASMSAINQPVVYDMKGNSMKADPKLKGVLGRGIKVDAALITATQKLQFDIEI